METGGMMGSQSEGMVSPLSPEETVRYCRQLMLPEIGSDGQEKLKRATVLIAGAGGLGSVSAYYLAAAGIGRIRIVDMDCVELENLNRQILHGTRDIGKFKTESAYNKLRDLNPHCSIQPVQEKIHEGNIMNLAEGCTVIVDAMDNVETRKIINRASVRSSIPFIYGGINGFTGMTTTLVPGLTPCFECLFPHQVSSEIKAGVIGPIPGIIASIQSLEAIKLILGMKELLTGKLLYIDGRDMSFRKLDIQRNPACNVCNHPAEE